MPRGFDGVRKAAAQNRAKRDAAGGFAPPALYFQLENGETAIVRFLEENEDIAWCYVHQVPVDGRTWGRDVPCLDQNEEGDPCPGCERDIKKKVKGFINLIWYDAPVYQKDKEGKFEKVNGQKVHIGNETQVALWTSGVQLFENLDEINDKYKGLRSRRFEVKRKGVKLDTKYIIAPEDVDSGPQPFTIIERKLAASAYNLEEFMKTPTYEEFVTIIDGGTGTPSQTSRSGGENPVAVAKKRNPFTKNRS